MVLTGANFIDPEMRKSKADLSSIWKQNVISEGNVVKHNFQYGNDPDC